MTAPGTTDSDTARIAAIWAGLLDRPEIGTDDNVFRLGASSVMAVRAAARIREALDTPLPLRDVFASPSADARQTHRRRVVERLPAGDLRDRQGEQCPA